MSDHKRPRTLATYTFAVLEVSPAVYDEVRARLMEADYGHTLTDDGDKAEVIDMHGIALKRLSE